MVRASILVFALLLVQALCSYKFKEYTNQLEKSVYPQKAFKDLDTLKEFVRLVEENNLNVSLIISSGKNYKNGMLKEASTMTVTFPVNEASVTTATLSKESFAKLADVANGENLTVGWSVAVNNELKVVTNNKKGLPITKAYKIFTGIKNGKTGFVFDEKNYVAQYTFTVPGGDGKNHTTKVFYGDVDVDVVGKSSNVSDDDVAIIKKSVVEAVFSYDEEFVSKSAVAILATVLPNRILDFASGVGDNSCIDSDYWVQLKILGVNYLIFNA